MISVLVGNGININFGGKAYSNRFIMTRMKFYAGTKEYDRLFEDTLSGKDIITGMEGFVTIANDILEGKYEEVDDVVLKSAIQDFRKRYNERESFQKYYEIPMEDWFLLMEVFYLDNPDLVDMKHAAKQGMERMVLDAIYNEGKIQDIYLSMNKYVKKYFNRFDNIFTLNYDNNLERLCKREVYHLHGDYSVLADSENPMVVQGFSRKSKGTRALIPGYEHCFCNALLDYSGDLKYKRAKDNKRISQFFKELLKQSVTDPVQFRKSRLELSKKVPESADWIDAYIEHPDLSVCTDYHFEKLENLSGELHIIGLSPNNDSHIFKCIDRSDVSRVVFYFNRNKPGSLPLQKPYCFESASDLWKKLGAENKMYNHRIDIPDSEEGNRILSIFNALSFDAITRKELETELRSIPDFISLPLCKEAVSYMDEQQQMGPIKDEEEQQKQFMDVGKIALREGILPSAFYYLLTDYLKQAK